MSKPKKILAIETSCDETAVAIIEGEDHLLAHKIASQAALHQPYGGVVPEVASRNHNLKLKPLIEETLAEAQLNIKEIDAFAATAGPGLASSLLIGNTTAKALAFGLKKPFLAINHLEGHLLSPFLGEAIRPCISLIVSGGHTLLIHLHDVGAYDLLGKTRDDAAGEAFDKVAKMLNLPYPGGPEIDRLAQEGDPTAYAFPRSMLGSNDHDFSFSGLKTAVLYTLEKISPLDATVLKNICASFQEAVVEVLVEKTLRAAKEKKEPLVGISGGVSCNSRLRAVFAKRCQEEGKELKLAEPEFTTDNAAMIAFVAAQKLKRGFSSALTEDVDPNLPLAN